MKNGDEPYPVEVFRGTAWEAGLLKSILEDNEILTIMKESAPMPLNMMPLNSNSVIVYVSSDDYEFAAQIVQEFFNNMQKQSPGEEE